MDHLRRADVRRPAQDAAAPPPGAAPPRSRCRRVTILIPAKDEGERIRACIESALAQDYPNFDVIAIDDRSTDNTGAVMDEMAAGNPRLKVLHITEPPPARAGPARTTPCYQGQKQRDGDWLLFVDSDVVLRAGRAVGVDGGRAAQEVRPAQPPAASSRATIWESLLVPLCRQRGVEHVPDRADQHTSTCETAFANGQFLMISRQAYDAIGGHETVRTATARTSRSPG